MGVELIVSGCDLQCLGVSLEVLQVIFDLLYQVIQVDFMVVEQCVVLVVVFDGEIYGVVYSVGIFCLCLVCMMSEVYLYEVQLINVDLLMLFIQVLLKCNLIVVGGLILFIVFIVVYIGVVGVGVYLGIKVVLIVMFCCLVMEVVKWWIWVNCLLLVLVEILLLEVMVQVVGFMDIECNNYLLGFGKFEDIVNVVIFMFFDVSCWVIGMILVMDGGLIIS